MRSRQVIYFSTYHPKMRVLNIFRALLYMRLERKSRNAHLHSGILVVRTQIDLCAKSDNLSANLRVQWVAVLRKVCFHKVYCSSSLHQHLNIPLCLHDVEEALC